jgi:hypothetical protein
VAPPPPDGEWEAGGLFGFVMPNGKDIAAPLLAGAGRLLQFLAVSHNNGDSWPQLIAVSDGLNYTTLPTNESTYITTSGKSILGFDRNNGWSADCVNSRSQSSCAGPDGAGGLLMIHRERTRNEMDWVIQPITIPLTQPLCNGSPSATLLRYQYVTPQLIPAFDPEDVTLTYGERQYCSGAVTVSYLKAVTFNPDVVAEDPGQIGSAQTLDTAPGSQYVGYGGVLFLSPSEYLVTYEKGCPLAYCFVSQDMLTATPR